MRPLQGIKVIEMAGLAPGPYCGMLLADFGAEVVVLDRPSWTAPEIPNKMAHNPLDRGKRSIRINLKTEAGAEILDSMITRSDVLLEPYRPGVMESLGFGPEDCFGINPELIYARLTGWGQQGPNAKMAGHDIDYIALSGALSLFKRKGEKPLPPCNLLGDFAGGGLMCTLGILLALFERNRSGRGQVVDAAMLDGAANLTTFFYGLFAHSLMRPEIGTNMLDSGAPFYQTYETSDGRYVAVGAIESRFYHQLLRGLGLDPGSVPDQNDEHRWPELTRRFAEIFKKKTRKEWTEIFEETDACVAPVLELNEVQNHPHNRERGILVDINGLTQPAPSPRLSRTPGQVLEPEKSDRTREILIELGYRDETIQSFFDNGVAERQGSRLQG